MQEIPCRRAVLRVRVPRRYGGRTGLDRSGFDNSRRIIENAGSRSPLANGISRRPSPYALVPRPMAAAAILAAKHDYSSSDPFLLRQKEFGH
ncbi:hypothetical protein KPH14_003082 [Odynerus spinipes]|uniref:Uncharacterized protein n=1 Tax=Odynerus spinipes TaxID=1348599 RepID=A0AAD9RXD2_9HYME|nr:hypothetical protein KPH14_003082 [Odynerus spinipes]